MTGDLARVAQVVRAETGISLQPEQDEVFLRGALARAFPDAADPAAFLRLADDPASRRAAVDRLLEEVTINETSFFREQGQLDSIPWHSLAESATARHGGPVRVWSAACSTGEEAYSLAILAWEAFGGSTPPVEILGTDISAVALARAGEARYGERSLRAVDAPMRARYFTEEGRGARVQERVRQLVRFRRSNLVSSPLPPGDERRFELIVCRNVLIYFDTETVGRVTPTLEDALHPGGMLILGSADTLCVTAERLARMSAPTQPPLASPTWSWRRSTAPRTGAPTPEDLFSRGLRELQAGEPRAATETLRQALYSDPSFGIAAFQLGRAHEACGDPDAARQAYARSLHLFEDHGAAGYDVLLGQLHVGDVVAACRARLGLARGPG